MTDELKEYKNFSLKKHGNVTLLRRQKTQTLQVWIPPYGPIGVTIKLGDDGKLDKPLTEITDDDMDSFIDDLKSTMAEQKIIGHTKEDAESGGYAKELKKMEKK